jgi:hypothetical protein
MTRKPPDPQALLRAHMKASANMKKWALVAKDHMEADRRELAAKALKKAEYWESKLKLLEA